MGMGTSSFSHPRIESSMGVKQPRSTTIVEALEVNYIRYSIVTLPVYKNKKSHSLSRLFRRRSSQKLEMPKDVIQIMANNKGNGGSIRFQDVRMREDAKVDRCLVSPACAKSLLGDGETESIEPQTVELSDGKRYSCIAKFDARWGKKSEPSTAPIVLYVAPDIREQAIFPKNQTLQTRGSTIAPLEGRPRNSGITRASALSGRAQLTVYTEQKKEDAERDKEAKKVNQTTVQENQVKKKQEFANNTKKP
ncbi:hypothetical protein LTS15_008388 [Exophiala xenobiotica]|nr:hypothetical protein LTS15_008388 [Exophiala xenobiotica]